MEFDLHKVRTSDLIIVNLTHPNSIGTSIELFLANQLHIPVISYGIPITQIHPWIELMLTKQCVSEKDMLDYITCYYIGRGKI
jgi:hypothetical protein